MRIAPLPPTDILRHLPSIVDPQQRLRIDVQVYCHDVMLAALDRLRATCAAIDPVVLSPTLVASMFADGYAIVDQIDLVRQVITATPGENGPTTAAFLEEAAGGRRIRNAMDHVSQRIPNIAGRVGASEALFGSISFVRCADEVLAGTQVGESVMAEMVMIARGTVPGYRGGASASFDTGDVDRSISNLRLNAAGQSVRLDWACAQLTTIVEGMSDDIAASIREQLPEFARRTGATPEALLSPTPTTVGAACPIEFPFGSADELARRESEQPS